MVDFLGKNALLAAVFFALVAPCHGEKFYTDSDLPGYWWGKDPVEEQTEETETTTPSPREEQKAKEKPEETKKVPRNPKLSDYSVQQLWDMHPDDFTILLEAFRKQAVQNPTDENVTAHLKVQDIARRKALAYSNAQQYALLKHPELSLERDYPVSGPGKEAVKSITNSNQESRITAARNNFGLIYFYQDGCPYCVAQQKILQYFIQSKKWTVKPVNIQMDPGASARFNISTTPTLILVKQGEDGYLPLSSGIISLEELEGRIYNGIRLLDGEITTEQFNMRDFQRGGGFDPLAPLQQQ